jgi:hypothetical protein
MQVESNSLKQDSEMTLLVLKTTNEKDDVAESSRPPRSALGELKANGGEISSTPLVYTRYNQRHPGSIEAQGLLVGGQRCWWDPISYSSNHFLGH